MPWLSIRVAWAWRRSWKRIGVEAPRFRGHVVVR
jgi:hypothetical protein